MDFDAFVARVRARTSTDPSQAVARYRASTTSPTTDGLLRYLREQGVLDASAFAELHTSGAVESSAVRVAAGPRTTRGTLLMEVAAAAQTMPSTPDTTATRLGNDETHPADGLSTRIDGMDGDGAGADGDGAPEVYELLGELGKGAMGAVHLARDMLLRRKVALKSILPAMQSNRALFSRFLGEMQITAQLDHPFIVPVYGVENLPGGGLAYAMKLVQGREFADLLEETRQALHAGKPLDQAHSLEGRLEAFLKVCDAVAFAHERGVVHRDLKPANIMIGRFHEVYVMDWGIARIMGKAGAGSDAGVEVYDAEGQDVRQTNRTRLGSTIGTPVYMSPEQAAGKNDELDGRSDLYSLGLILQEIVTLTQAVGGTTLEEVLTNAKGARRIPPRPAAPGVVVPRELRAIIDRATRLSPADRYPGVKEFADDIRRYLADEAVTAEPDTGLQRAGRWIGKNRMTAVALLMGALTLGAGATIGVLLYNQAALAAQHTRELRLAELQASSALRAQGLDATLQRHESQLTRLAGAAGLALGEGRGGEARIFPAGAFEPGPNAVPGLVNSTVHGGHVSFEFPVVSLAPGMSQDAAAVQLASIDGLRTLAKAVMLESLDPDFHDMPEAERARALGETGTPITRILLTLESGLHLEYPGSARRAPDYDGRKEPAYQAARAQREVTWSAPRSSEDGFVLTCTAPLLDVEGRLLGVLAFEVDPASAVQASLDAGDAAHVETSLLIDTSGKVLAQKNRSGVAPQGAELDLKEVREAVARGESGTLQTQREGRDVLVTYQPLSSVGWYVVTVASEDAIERADVPTPGAPRGGSIVVAPTATAAAKAKPKPPQPAPVVTAAPAPEPTVDPSASASASAAPSASAPPSAAPSASAPALWGKLPTAAPSASAPPPPPPNPFDPWKAYEKAPKK